MSTASGISPVPSEAAPSIFNEGADTTYLIVPDAKLLFSAEFKRSGSDLTCLAPFFSTSDLVVH